MRNIFFIFLAAVFFIGCNANSQNNKHTKPTNHKTTLPKVYNLQTPTIDIKHSLDSVELGDWISPDWSLDGYDKYKTVIRIYSKKNKFFEVDFYFKNNKFYNPYPSENEYEIIKKNNRIYLTDKSRFLSHLAGVSISDSTLFFIKKDEVQSSEIFTKLRYLNQPIDEVNHYRSVCRKNDSTTLYRFGSHEFQSIFRLYKQGDKFYLQAYNKTREIQNHAVIASQHPQGIRYDYTDKDLQRQRGEYWILQTKDTALIFMDAVKNEQFEKANHYRKWNYDFSPLDSAWFHY
jgi:hypothetical protein